MKLIFFSLFLNTLSYYQKNLCGNLFNTNEHETLIETGLETV
jgi:hypothetical protein